MTLGFFMDCVRVLETSPLGGEHKNCQIGVHHGRARIIRPEGTPEEKLPGRRVKMNPVVHLLNRLVEVRWPVLAP
jgi:hypothetical protein